MLLSKSILFLLSALALRVVPGASATFQLVRKPNGDLVAVGTVNGQPVEYPCGFQYEMDEGDVQCYDPATGTPIPVQQQQITYYEPGLDDPPPRTISTSGTTSGTTSPVDTAPEATPSNENMTVRTICGVNVKFPAFPVLIGMVAAVAGVLLAYFAYVFRCKKANPQSVSNRGKSSDESPTVMEDEETNTVDDVEGGNRMD